jgi:replication initiation and membrane attachment protein DnaB
VPEQFSWLDQRLVRDGYIDQLGHTACALYLFLVTVADARGLSFYSDLSLCRRLSMPGSDLHKARKTLIQCGLLAYDSPLYQVLALDGQPPLPVPQSPRMTTADTPVAIKDIFKHIAETLS